MTRDKGYPSWFAWAVLALLVAALIGSLTGCNERKTGLPAREKTMLQGRHVDRPCCHGSYVVERTRD